MNGPTIRSSGAADCAFSVIEVFPRSQLNFVVLSGSVIEAAAGVAAVGHAGVPYIVFRLRSHAFRSAS